MLRLFVYIYKIALVAELVDALDSKSSSFGSVGSIPTQGTYMFQVSIIIGLNFTEVSLLLFHSLIHLLNSTTDLLLTFINGTISSKLSRGLIILSISTAKAQNFGYLSEPKPMIEKFILLG